MCRCRSSRWTFNEHQTRWVRDAVKGFAALVLELSKLNLGDYRVTEVLNAGALRGSRGEFTNDACEPGVIARLVDALAQGSVNTASAVLRFHDRHVHQQGVSGIALSTVCSKSFQLSQQGLDRLEAIGRITRIVRLREIVTRNNRLLGVCLRQSYNIDVVERRGHTLSITRLGVSRRLFISLAGLWNHEYLVHILHRHDRLIHR